MATIIGGFVALVLVGATAVGVVKSVGDTHAPNSSTSTVVPYGDR